MSITQKWIFFLSKHWEILSTISHICFEKMLTPEKVTEEIKPEVFKSLLSLI
jgi:hypothetical protein